MGTGLRQRYQGRRAEPPGALGGHALPLPLRCWPWGRAAGPQRVGPLAGWEVCPAALAATAWGLTGNQPRAPPGPWCAVCRARPLSRHQHTETRAWARILRSTGRWPGARLRLATPSAQGAEVQSTPQVASCQVGRLCWRLHETESSARPPPAPSAPTLPALPGLAGTAGHTRLP